MNTAQNSAPDTFNPTMQVTINTFPKGGGRITDFTLSPLGDLSPLAFNPKNNVLSLSAVCLRLANSYQPPVGTTIGLQFRFPQGDTTYNFSGTGLVPPSITANGADPVKFGPPFVSKDRQSVTWPMTVVAFSGGETKGNEYNLKIEPAGSPGLVGIIDPDFETDSSTDTP